MADLKFEINSNGSGVEVTLNRDTVLYQVVGKNSAAQVAALPKGEEVVVGGSDQIIKLIYDHRLDTFTPVISELESDKQDADELTTFFIRTRDLPDDY